MKLCKSCKNGLHGNPNICSVCGADLSAAGECSYDGLVGMTIQGKYEFVAFLGEGAMGCVYRAVHTMLNRSVAVKLMKAVEVNETETRNRFEREARAASRLNHPHVVAVVDFGTTEGGFLYLITEYVEGKTLMDMLKQTPVLPFSRLFTIFFDVLAAIEEAHTARIIHRDLKPENILVSELRTGEDFVKVADFGVASLEDEQSSKITLAGTCVGTPGYIAPEHILGEEATERSDIYALGAILYELLAGRPAYEVGNPTKMLTEQIASDPPPLTEIAKRNDIVQSLEQLVKKAMARDPMERFGNVPEFTVALFEVVSDLNFDAIDRGSIAASFPFYKQVTGRHKAPTTKALSSMVPKTISAVALKRTEPSVSVQTSVNDGLSTEERESRLNALRQAAVGEALLGWSKTVEHLVHFMASKAVFLDICGPEGAGKSAVALSIARCAEVLDLVVYNTEPDPWLAKTPWYPVRRIVGQIIGCGPDPSDKEALLVQLESSPLSGAADVKGLFQLFGFGPYESGAQLSDRLHTSIIETISHGYENKGGICLLLEDAQGYDRASLKFFKHLIENHAGRLKIAATTDAGLYPTREEGRLQPSPLDETAVASLISRFIRNTSLHSPELTKRILNFSRGNPLHAIQLVRCIDEGGCLDEDKPRHQSLEETIETRLSKLTSETRTLFEAICVLGRSVTTELLDELLHDDQLFLELEWLRLAGWISVDKTRTVCPTHPTVAHIVREMMPGSKLLQLHRDIVAVLERRNVSVFVLAHHAWEGKMGHRAVGLLEKAGDAAAAWFNEEQAALEHYKRAAHIARWDLLKGEEDPDYLNLQLKLGKALKHSGHIVSAKMVLKDVISSSERFPKIKDEASLTLQ